jgi:hypothetical protein
VVCSVLSRTLYVSNVAAHVLSEDLERLVAPLGTLQKCEKVNGSGRQESSSPGSTQTFEVVYETAEDADK